MKTILKLLSLTFLLFIVTSCSQGAAAVDKAYEETCEASSPEKVAMTLCNGDIKVSTLTTDEISKLGAVLEYLKYTGMYSANFQAQVDMYEFGRLLKEYRAHNLTPDEKLQIEDLTKKIFLDTQHLQLKSDNIQ